MAELQRSWSHACRPPCRSSSDVSSRAAHTMKPRGTGCQEGVPVDSLDVPEIATMSVGTGSAAGRQPAGKGPLEALSPCSSGPRFGGPERRNAARGRDLRDPRHKNVTVRKPAGPNRVFLKPPIPSRLPPGAGSLPATRRSSASQRSAACVEARVSPQRPFLRPRLWRPCPTLLRSHSTPSSGRACSTRAASGFTVSTTSWAVVTAAATPATHT